MESTKTVSFAPATKAKYERVQIQQPTTPVDVTRETSSVIETGQSISSTSYLRRRSSIISNEPNQSSHSFREENRFHEARQNDNDANEGFDRQTGTSSSNGVGFWEYVSVLARHPAYRAYLASHLCQNLGDYFVRIANVLVVEEFSTRSNDDDSGTALAYVTLARLLPSAIFALVGGVLADKLNKRNLMVTVDCLSGLVVLGYLLALHYESLPLLYTVTVLRSALSATYYPSASGIVVDLVAGGNETSDAKSFSARRDLQLAVTLNSWAWGGSVIVGGLLAGKLAAMLGLKSCYFIDCATYLTSAVLIARGVKPDYHQHSSKEEPTDGNTGTDSFQDEPQANFEKTDTCENRSLLGYLVACGFGWMVFAKPSASLVWGIEDIVGAQFATVFEEDGTEDTALSSIHMGVLFSTVGLGCSIGPLLLNTVTDSRIPHTLQRACLIGLALLSLGWLAISFVNTFPQFLLGTFLRTMGSGAAYVYSSLILQTLCDSTYLGRVLALEHTLTTLFEAATSYVAGHLSSSRGLTDNQLALLGACIGLAVVIFWGFYYSLSQGAAHPRFNRSMATKDKYTVVQETKELETGNKEFGDSSGSESMHNISEGLV